MTTRHRQGRGTAELALGLGAALALLLPVGCRSGELTGPSDAIGGGATDTSVRLKSATFTTSYDFSTGTLSGVNANNEGDLRMTSAMDVFETPFIWIPNSTDRTVTQIDTQTLNVKGTHGLASNGVDCHNPSRTTVDIDGNVWVGCRGTASYIDREDIKSGDVPVAVDNKVVKLAKTDGSVLLSVVVGHAPRALALDVKNRLWVGNSVDDTVWAIDGATGQCLRGEGSGCPAPATAVSDFPYGAAVDQRGHLWVVSLGVKPTERLPVLTEIDTETGQVLGQYGPFARKAGCNELYGIAIDHLNNVWLGGFNCSDVVKVKGVSGKDPTTGKNHKAGEMIAYYDVGGETSRGVAVDMDNNVWVALSSTDTASKISGTDGQIIHSVNVGSGPIGVAVDAYGNAWVVNRNSDSVHRINGLLPSDKQEIKVGAGPYSYSDMMGTALRTVTHNKAGFAAWSVKVDAGVTSPAWKNVSWHATQPDSSAIEVQTRCAATSAGLGQAPCAGWNAVGASPAQIDCAGCAGGQWLEVRVQFFADPATKAKPILHDLTVYWE